MVGSGGGSGWGVCQGGWELRSEAFVKIPKKKFFLGGGGVGASGWGGVQSVVGVGEVG